MKSHFLILADRGNVRAYCAEKAEGEALSHLYLVQAITLSEVPPVRAKRTDRLGARRGASLPSAAERELQNEQKRLEARQLAGHINAILRQEQPANWAFAAPSEFQSAVLEQIDYSFRRNLSEAVAEDLIRVPVGELLKHFSTAAEV
jgi:Protein required for attachment to host cells